MTDRKASALDPALFADSPARDARFTVVERWAECANFPKGTRCERSSSFIGR